VTGNIPGIEGDGGNAGQSSAVQCVVNVYGPSDFTKSYGKSVDAAEVLPLFLGGNVEQQRKRHLEASPLYWVTPSAPPTLCIHGTQDKYVAYEQSIWIVDRLLAAGCDAELTTISGGGHGFNAEQSKVADAALFAWFDKYLKAGK
jgi:dipeptidyl aminopeptidase/acylaminoacyl peptidase